MSDAMDWDKILEAQAKDTGFGIVPANKYPCRISKAEAVTAGSGNPMINVQAEIMGGPYDTRKIFDRFVFSPNPTAMKFTLRDLNAFGITKDYLRQHNPSVAQIAKLLEGREATADVVVGEYENEPSNEVKSWKRLSGTTALTDAPAAGPASGPSAPSLPKSGGGSGSGPGAPSVPAPPADEAAPGVPAGVPAGDEEPF